jgi:hypothetical protein
MPAQSTPGRRAGLASAADHPDQLDAVLELLGSRWPRFMLAGRPGHDVDLIAALLRHLRYQVLLFADDGTLIGAGLALPVYWDGTVKGLPAGWDGAVTASENAEPAGPVPEAAHPEAAHPKAAHPKAAPTALCALSITIAAEHAGQECSARIMAQMRAVAALGGLPHVIVPVRPVHKTRYPLTSMERYLTWRTDDGRVFDPWLRCHLSLGATLLAVAPESMTITGTVAEWQDWLGMALPETGDYIIRGGLAPLAVDRAADRGVYREANVWVVHTDPSGNNSAA